MGEMIGDIAGSVILAILIVQAVRYCAERAHDAAEAIRDGVGGYTPAKRRAPDEVQKLRDSGAL